MWPKSDQDADNGVDLGFLSAYDQAAVGPEIPPVDVQVDVEIPADVEITLQVPSDYDLAAKGPQPPPGSESINRLHEILDDETQHQVIRPVYAPPQVVFVNGRQPVAP